MTTYQFRCEAGHVTDCQRPPDDAMRDTVCQECGRTAKRLYRLRGIGFKGSGFYTTDYGRVTPTRR